MHFHRQLDIATIIHYVGMSVSFELYDASSCYSCFQIIRQFSCLMWSMEGRNKFSWFRDPTGICIARLSGVVFMLLLSIPSERHSEIGELKMTGLNCKHPGRNASYKKENWLSIGKCPYCSLLTVPYFNDPSHPSLY